MAEYRINTKLIDGVLVASFSDAELMDEPQIRKLGEQLVEASGKTPNKAMLISFDGVKFVTSSLLGQLVMVNRCCEAAGVTLKICEAGETLRDIFRIVRLGTLVEIRDELNEALKSIQNEANATTLAEEDSRADDHRAAADAGDADAQFHLGRCYEEGKGVAIDFAKALEWYEKAANAGQRDAQYKLGSFYAYAMQVPQDYKSAFEWFKKAAEQGHSTAQYMLGLSYSNALADVQDDQLAVKWFTLAAEAGDVEAQFNLAEAYREGRGIEADEAKAIQWYQAAEANGHAGAKSVLAQVPAKSEEE